MEDSTLLNSSPNPDKLKNKLKIEQDWAKKIIDKGDCVDTFTKLLFKLDNPLQIWIKGQALLSLDSDCANMFLDKAKELGYESDVFIKLDEPVIVGNGIFEGLSTTKFNDGTYVFSTKNLELIKKINELSSGFVTSEDETKVVLYPQNDTTREFNMFLSKTDINVENPKYDENALMSLINNDPFLKFNYQNLTIGDKRKDLDMIWNAYVQDDVILLNKLKQFEQYILHNESIQSNKLEFFNDLKSLLVEHKLDTLVNVNSLSLLLNEYIKENKKTFDLFLSTYKVEWKNISFNQSLSNIYKTLSETKIVHSDVSDNKAIDKLVESIKVSYDLSGALTQGPVNESLNIAKKYLYIGQKEATKLFNVVLSIFIKQIPV